VMICLGPILTFCLLGVVRQDEGGIGVGDPGVCLLACPWRSLVEQQNHEAQPGWKSQESRSGSKREMEFALG
jgi:hypothetical protein